MFHEMTTMRMVSGVPDNTCATRHRAAVPQEAHEALGLTFGGSDDAAAAAADEAAAGAILEADVQWLLRHDPRPDMEALQCAVMALGGGRDLQVRASHGLIGWLVGWLVG